MDDLLLPYLRATNESEVQAHLDDLLVVHAAPVVRQALRRKLGFHVDSHGVNARNRDAEDLYQEVMTKIVQMLHDVRASASRTEVVKFLQYVSRIASNACMDVLRTKAPGRARLTNNLRFLLGYETDFALWQGESGKLCGLAIWRDKKSISPEERLIEIEEGLAVFRSTRFRGENIKQVPLPRVVAELFNWIGGPIELAVLVNIVAQLRDVQDRPVMSIDDETKAPPDALVAYALLTSNSRLEKQEMFSQLWQAVKGLAKGQRDTFSYGFEDDRGRDLFTVLIEAEVVTIAGLAQELRRPQESLLEIWSRMPMDDATIAVELNATLTQVWRWRWRALDRLKDELPLVQRK